jgi:hypothetical protein
MAAIVTYCIGIEDKGNVSIQLIEVGSSKMLWVYSVNKQRSGSKNQQSMAEAIAKHFKDSIAGAQPAVRAAIEAAALAPLPTRVPGPPVVSPASALATPIAYQHQDDVHIELATQAEPQPVREEANLGDAARRSKQQKTCLELAKDNLFCESI